MNIFNFRFFFTLQCVCITLLSYSQNDSNEVVADWFLKDPEQDSLFGVSAERAYLTLLNNKPSRTILVGVIDSGVDIDHEDLKNVIWTNEKEIAGNGVDDDQNGYVDDVHGWNFIGGKNGNVDADTYELTREFVRLNAKFGSVDSARVPKKLSNEYQSYQKIKKTYRELKSKNEQQYKMYANHYRTVKTSYDSLCKFFHVDTLNAKLVNNLVTKDPNLLFYKSMISGIYKNRGEEMNIPEYLSQIKEGVDYFGVIVNYGYNSDFNSRNIVGDNYANPHERIYGNNDVKGPDPTHGTHVAGIIAANRKNDIGIKGIADNVKIMPIRAVPNGDERDKDVANAIYYAVDNGAQIINMSFGKSFSPDKKVVDEAVRYAQKRGVLLIHAAGNDGNDLDGDKKNFPTDKLSNGKKAKNWIEVGASSWDKGDNLVGSFSNYGKNTVSVFAPGVKMYSTTPKNTYKYENGTSMASPSAAGVAAIIMSYFPHLTALQVKDILLQSVNKFPNLKVYKPKSKELVSMSELCYSGGSLNVFQAIKLASSLKKTKD